MKKISFEEAIQALEEGKRVFTSCQDYFFYKNEKLYRKNENSGEVIYNPSLFSVTEFCLPEEPKPLEITKTGLYKSKNGKRIFLYHKGSDVNFFDGVIEGEVIEGIWGADGKESDGNEHYDIVGEWDDGQH